MFAKSATLIALIALTFAGTARSDVVTEYDQARNCTWYKVVNRVTNANGDVVLERELTDGEESISKKSLYGFGLKDLEINFGEREVSFNVEQKIILGLNRNLMSEKVTLSSDHPDFNQIINEVNIDIMLMDGVCLSKNGEFVDSFKLKR